MDRLTLILIVGACTFLVITLFVIGPDNLDTAIYRITLGVMNGVVIAVVFLGVRWLWRKLRGTQK